MYDMSKDQRITDYAQTIENSCCAVGHPIWLLENPGKTTSEGHISKLRQ